MGGAGLGWFNTGGEIFGGSAGGVSVFAAGGNGRPGVVTLPGAAFVGGKIDGGFGRGEGDAEAGAADGCEGKGLAAGGGGGFGEAIEAGEAGDGGRKDTRAEAGGAGFGGAGGSGFGPAGAGAPLLAGGAALAGSAMGLGGVDSGGFGRTTERGSGGGAFGARFGRFMRTVSF
jgi:hypothetical protein